MKKKTKNKTTKKLYPLLKGRINIVDLSEYGGPSGVVAYEFLDLNFNHISVPTKPHE